MLAGARAWVRPGTQTAHPNTVISGVKHHILAPRRAGLGNTTFCLPVLTKIVTLADLWPQVRRSIGQRF